MKPARKYDAVDKVVAVITADREVGIHHERFEVAPEFYRLLTLAMNSRFTLLPLYESITPGFTTITVLGVPVVPRGAP